MGMEEKLVKEVSVVASPEDDFIDEATRNESNRKMKVPGEVAAIGKMSFEVAKLRSELKTKTIPQLEEVLKRQENLLMNKSLVRKLPDKGEKARKTVDLIQVLLKEKAMVKDLEEDMNKLKIYTEAMEWKNTLLDSDDDSDPEVDVPVKNPLTVLAQGVIPAKSKRGKIEADFTHKYELEEFAKKEAEKVDNTQQKETFVPYRSARSTCVDECLKQKLTPGGVKSTQSSTRHLNHPKTPSIPLPPVYMCQSKQLSLADSLKLQQEQDVKLREMQMKHAAEKLSQGVAKLEVVVAGQFEEYRDTKEESEGEEEGDSGDEGVGVVGVQQIVEDDDS